jgi:hypothetical protein
MSNIWSYQGVVFAADERIHDVFFKQMGKLRGSFMDSYSIVMRFKIFIAPNYNGFVYYAYSCYMKDKATI